MIMVNFIFLSNKKEEISVDNVTDKTTVKLRSEEIINNFPKPKEDINNVSDIGKYLGEHLLELYKQRIKNLNDSDDKYNLVITSIIANGILFEPLNLDLNNSVIEDYNWVVDKQKEIDEIIGNNAPIFYGFSRFGVLYLAIANPIQSTNNDFTATINKLRNNNNESDFLKDLEQEAHLFALDIYSIDLLGLNKEKKIDEVYYIHNNNYDNEIHPVSINIEENKVLRNILEKYNRKINNDKETEWRLVLFNSSNGFPSRVVIETSDGTFVPLVNTNHSFTNHHLTEKDLY